MTVCKCCGAHKPEFKIIGPVPPLDKNSPAYEAFKPAREAIKKLKEDIREGRI